jgi:hypothetical protein
VGLLHRSLDLVEAHEVRGLLDVVDDVVELGGERVEVGAVHALGGIDVQAPDDLLRDAVTLLLGLQDLAGELLLLGPGLEHPLEQLRRPEDVRAGLREELEIGEIPAGERAKGHRSQATTH